MSKGRQITNTSQGQAREQGVKDVLGNIWIFQNQWKEANKERW